MSPEPRFSDTARPGTDVCVARGALLPTCEWAESICMSLNKILLSVALTFGFCAPALAEAPESMMVAQAKSKSIKRRAKKAKVAKKKAKVAKKKVVAKKAAPPVEMAGEIQVERTKKGVIKSAHLIIADGEKIQIVLNPKGRSLAKLGGAMKVTGKVHTRKGAKFIRVAMFAALPKPVEEPEVAEVPVPAEPAQLNPAVGEDGDDDAPMNDDDAPDDDDSMNDDAPSDDAPSDDAPGDDDDNNNGE